jgi:hypothetical protein
MKWSGGVVESQPIEGGSDEKALVDLRGSVLRAVIARLAALCNQQQAKAVSPYGGQGEFIDERPPFTKYFELCDENAAVCSSHSSIPSATIPKAAPINLSARPRQLGFAGFLGGDYGPVCHAWCEGNDCPESQGN